MKPLKGCDETTRASLESWLKQDYAGTTEILFGVADANDPVCEIVRALMAAHPDCRAQLMIGKNLAGPNAKVAKLAQLEKLAVHDLIVTCDADVRVPPDFLASFVAPLRNEKTALVNCFYRLANPSTRAMQWEAVAVNADFWSQVLQSQTLKPLDFALGAAILVRRNALKEIGGFEALVSCLADDFQLGRRVVRNGHCIALCPLVVECWDIAQGWSPGLEAPAALGTNHSRLPARGIFFQHFIKCQLMAALVAVRSVLAGNYIFAPLSTFLFLLLRILLAQNLQRRFTPQRRLVSPFWLVLEKDLIQAAIWLAAFLGSTVEWRGRKMKVRSDGTLVEN